MSTGGGKPQPNLLPDATLADLEKASTEREVEAALLASGGYHSMALALRLYSLEIRLKTIICRHLMLDRLPRSCKTHDLSELIIFTGLWSELIDPANDALFSNWERLTTFSRLRLNDLRYQPMVSLDAVNYSQLTTALDHPADGVLAWLSRRP